MKLVIVESPAKAKTINKYLGEGYKVIASYGHVRDLPSKNGSVKPKENFAMTWEIGDKSKSHIETITKESKKADEILLATDPDREGEAISWHIQNIINERGIKDKPMHRIVFHEITKYAINNAINNPRSLDQSLIEAYLARRALDYLVGFSISPVLWRKLPGSKSAGRVQSVALRLIADRELEIEAFEPREYWTIEALFKTSNNDLFPAKLIILDSQKLDRFSLNNEVLAKAAVRKVESLKYNIANIEKKTIKRSPSPPFITSTLQQDASRKLGFSAKKTMQLAQALYEGVNINGETVGLITYMRTDSIQLSQEAISGIRNVINKSYGQKYLPKAPRIFTNKVKNAQEAHEAIRPTDVLRLPSKIEKAIDKDLWRLYELIWKRTIASQMEQALIDQVSVDIASENAQHSFRAAGSTIAFDGFMKLYNDQKDEDDESRSNILLPPLSLKETVDIEKLEDKQHFTQAPPRYSEASLVKKLEELGIGRPSTYANIIQVLQDRNYVKIDKKRFIPEERGIIVNIFLSNYFARYVEYDFTANLEQSLDDISNGKISWLKVLQDFWSGFEVSVEQSLNIRMSEVLSFIESKLEKHLFLTKDSQNIEEARVCLECKEGRINLKLGKYGAFLGCSRYPECKFTKPLYGVDKNEDTSASSVKFEPKELGIDAATGNKITLRKGPYGFYLQSGEASDKKSKRKKTSLSPSEASIAIKRVAIPKKLDPEKITFDQACILLKLPKSLGFHSDLNKEILLGIGRFGPYIKFDNKYFSIDYEQLFNISSVDQAISIMEKSLNKSRR